MFCSRCGNPLPDDAKFCAACGAPVNTAQENAPIRQQSSGIPDGTGNIQMPKPKPLMEGQNFHGQIGYGAAVPVQKKSKKGLVIGLSVGMAILLIAAAAVILFASGLFNPAPSSLFPVLDTGKTQIYYGESFDSLEKEFLNMEKRGSLYSLKQSGDQGLSCSVRTDKETGETKLVYWRTTMNNTGIANGISIGDSYERILAEYPDAMCSTEMVYGSSSLAHKYNPETDSRVSFAVYMDENGNTYSRTEYKKKYAASISERGSFDLTKWYAISFNVEDGQITLIDFGDLAAVQQGR